MEITREFLEEAVRVYWDGVGYPNLDFVLQGQNSVAFTSEFVKRFGSAALWIIDALPKDDDIRKVLIESGAGWAIAEYAIEVDKTCRKDTYEAVLKSKDIRACFRYMYVLLKRTDKAMRKVVLASKDVSLLDPWMLRAVVDQIKYLERDPADDDLREMVYRTHNSDIICTYAEYVEREFKEETLEALLNIDKDPESKCYDLYWYTVETVKHPVEAIEKALVSLGCEKVLLLYREFAAEHTPCSFTSEKDDK